MERALVVAPVKQPPNLDKQIHTMIMQQVPSYIRKAIGDQKVHPLKLEIVMGTLINTKISLIFPSKKLYAKQCLLSNL